MFIVSHKTLLNPGVLETRSLPKKFFGRVQLLPRKGRLGLWLRLIFEMQMVRYMGALLPFLVLPLMSRDLAQPVTQAPLAMLIVIAFVELKVLRLSEGARERLMSKPEAERIVDAFAFRAKTALRRLAARRELEVGQLVLVAEQSELARVAPLTLISIQTDTPRPQVMDLSEGDQAYLSDVFDETLTEKDLQNANLRLGISVQEVSIETKAISAHARLTAWMDRFAAEAPASGN
ncbi:hypothetical protein V8J82_02170 [Gymnodinialimonas sp. 2305UL16-5]|uniref:hypothetical protein n=1 Tax=Gymnodinialimonas mytili TaxID=3126503 RepID=UPI00309EE6C4